ncbi:protein kintoun [Gouania willdenowi]|uniref:Protein kintoun n=1 Tax=Gouania willdenowi TaxID=441366 RepID=A0A8C5GHM9_GOUWI|nr:protein kintoun [Gouania willdenowi]
MNMDELKELNMTTDEVCRLAEAFKDENFRNMLCDYAKEISDPENKRLYEEELKLLEQEKGNIIEFIHPEPFKVIKTSVDGKQKCFINICSSEKVGKPESKRGVGLDGDRGQCWSLPHSLHPGRPDTDGKGNKAMVYDVVFHPDTLYIASKNKLFMNMVDKTAIEGIQKAFKVTLDKNKVKDLKIKYKGTPQACVSRKPIPGCNAKESSEGLNHLLSPHPGEKETKHSSDPETEPTKPNHTVKYRSFIDVQDFTCSRDSTKSPTPKEIVVTIDLPLLQTISDTNLEVKDRSLMLESKKPAYKLELSLAYTVDEDKGRAQFIKQRRQLIVTLPVRPRAHSASECLAGNELEKAVEEDWKENEKMKQEAETKIPDVKQEEMIEYESALTDGETTESDVNGKSVDNEMTDYVAERINTSERVMREEYLQEEAQKSLTVTNETKNTAREDGCENEGKTASPRGLSKHDSTLGDRSEPNQLLQDNKEVKSSSLKASEMDDETRDNTVETDDPLLNPTPRAEVLPTVSNLQQGRTNGSELTKASIEQDNDDKPREHVFETSKCDKKPEAVELREIDQDGNETVITDHSTSAGFTFKNKLMFELD